MIEIAFLTKDKIVGVKCVVEDYFLINKNKCLRKKKGIIVGCYLHEYWHPYTYRAYHVLLDDGTEYTTRTGLDNIKFIEE